MHVSVTVSKFDFKKGFGHGNTSSELWMELYLIWINIEGKDCWVLYSIIPFPRDQF